MRDFHRYVLKHITRNFLLGKRIQGVEFFLHPIDPDYFPTQKHLLVELNLYTEIVPGLAEVDAWFILYQPHYSKKPKDYPAQLCTRSMLKGKAIVPNSTLQACIEELNEKNVGLIL